MKHYEKISFLSLPIAENEAEHQWFTENIDPMYRDTNTGLNEHLFSVDAIDNAKDDCSLGDEPEFIKTFLTEVRAVDQEVSYIRFVNY